MAGHRRKRVLLTMVGSNDPWRTHPVKEDGPVLALLALAKVDAVLLLHQDGTFFEAACLLEQEIRNRGHCRDVQLFRLDVVDPTDHASLLGRMIAGCERASNKWPHADFQIGTASGTPQMHAIWLLLALSGMFEAELLQAVRPCDTPDGQSAYRVVNETFAELRAKLPFLSSERGLWQAAGALRERDLLRAQQGDPQFLGRSPAIVRLLQKAQRVAEDDAPALITGPTGAGKEYLARWLHQRSARANGGFQPIDLAGFPPTLVHSELFGNVPGAYNDAVHRVGRVCQADGGTLFLDELGELPLDAQAALLHLVERRTVRPLGSEQDREVDVRIIAATNRDPHGPEFRSDLYHRLVWHLHVPPLYERTEDISPIAEHHLQRLNRETGEAKSLAPAALAALSRHPWPGNVRELLNVLRRSHRFCSTAEIGDDDLDFNPSQRDERAATDLPPPEDHRLPTEGVDLERYLGQLEGHLIDQALARTNHVRAEAARLLGLLPDTLRQRLRRSER